MILHENPKLCKLYLSNWGKTESQMAHKQTEGQCFMLVIIGISQESLSKHDEKVWKYAPPRKWYP